MHACNILNNGLEAMRLITKSDSTTVIDATNNWWGTTDSAAIEDMIYHNHDSSAIAIIDYIPCATEAFEIGDSSYTDVTEEPFSALPSSFILNQNYPNPFNNQTAIEHTLPRRADIDFTVYNILGQIVFSTRFENQPAGNHTIHFDAVDRNNNPLPTGVYFYQIATEDTKQTRKMVLLK